MKRLQLQFKMYLGCILMSIVAIGALAVPLMNWGGKLGNGYVAAFTMSLPFVYGGDLDVISIVLAIIYIANLIVALIALIVFFYRLLCIFSESARGRKAKNTGLMIALLVFLFVYGLSGILITVCYNLDNHTDHITLAYLPFLVSIVPFVIYFIYQRKLLLFTTEEEATIMVSRTSTEGLLDEELKVAKILHEYSEMKKEGALTQEEYEIYKKRLLKL